VIDLIGEPNRSDGPTTMPPMSAVAAFQFLPPTRDGGASYMMSEGDSSIEYPWVPDLGSLHPVAPMEVTADRWSTTSNLDFPPMEPLAVRSWNEVRMVDVPQLEASDG
jgi:hypothetical protein